MAVPFQSITDNQAGGVKISVPDGSGSNLSYVAANNLILSNNTSNYEWAIKNNNLSPQTISITAVTKFDKLPIEQEAHIEIPKNSSISLNSDPTKSYFMFLQGFRPQVGGGLDGDPSSSVAIKGDIMALVDKLVEFGILTEEQRCICNRDT